MSLFRIAIVMMIIGGITLPATAADLLESGAKAVEAQAEHASPIKSSASPALKWTGRGLFVGGMAVGLYGFINNKNGQVLGVRRSILIQQAPGCGGIECGLRRRGADAGRHPSPQQHAGGVGRAWRSLHQQERDVVSPC